MNDIPRDTTRAKLINSLLSPRHKPKANEPSLFQPDVIFGLAMTNSRLDDEQSVATIQFSDPPRWLKDLCEDPYGFPKCTPYGTLWRGTDRSAIDENGQTEFIRAVISGDLHLHYAEMLAEFTDTDTNVQDKQSRSALHWACAAALPDMVQLCLSVPECDVGLKDNEGLTAFDIALRSGSEIITTLFYRNIFEIEKGEPQTALLRALTISSESASDRPVFPGAAVFAPIEDGNTALVAALIHRVVDLTATNERGETALHVAAKMGDIEITTMLLNAGADVNATDNRGVTPLGHAERSSDTRMIQTLMHWQSGLNTGAIKGEPSSQHFPATKNDMERQPGVVNLAHPAAAAEKKDLLWSQDEIELKNDQGMTLLLQAALDGDLESVRILLELGANTEATDRQEQTALHLAVTRGRTEVVKTLLLSGAQIEAETSTGRTALLLAAEIGLEEIVNILLRGQGLIEEPGVVGTTEHRVPQSVQTHGANIHAKDHSHKTALNLAARSGHTGIVKLLLRDGAEVNEADNLSSTALLIAAEKGYTETVTTLLAAGADIEAVNIAKDRALHVAARSGHTETVKTLLDGGARIEAGAADKDRPLQMAAHNGHNETVITLLAGGAQIEANNKDSDRALHFAAYNGHTDIVNTLLESGAQIESTGNWNRTALHRATEGGHTETVKALLARGAQINAANISGDRAVHLAVKAGYSDIVNILLAGGAEIETSNGSWDKPLHQAARIGHREIVSALLARGAKINTLNYDGKTALEIALDGGHTAIVEALQDAGAQITSSVLRDALRLNVRSQQLVMRRRRRD